VTQQHSLTVPAGSVISQAPVADTQVLPGVAVDLVVSLGGIAVPDVVGRTLVTAITTTTGAGLKVGKMTREHSLTVPAGCIISQAPAAETQVLPGAAVDLAVSRGPEFVSVPNVAGLAQEAANAILGDTHLTVGTVTPSCSNTVVEGLVIAQTPAAGGQAAPGSAVALTVSTGPCNVAVPNVAGQTVAAADAALTAAGLAVGAVTSECSNTVAAGLVIRQNPAAGTEATSGNAVVLIVSGGPCPSEGEGEVETPPTEAELRGLLTANAAMADSNGDGTISYPEALAVLPGLTTTVFNSVDTNGDGQISRAEAGLDGNNGCMGCRGGKGTITFDALRKSFGNLFLGGLSLMALRAFGRRWMQ
jgi:beta-lactam-binding protein with PASTA domain